MQMIRRHHGNRFDSIIPLCFAFRHNLVIGINPLRVEPQILTRGLGALRIAGKRACHQNILIIHARGNPVHRSDESPLPAAHHAKPDATAMHAVAAPFNCHRCTLL